VNRINWQKLPRNPDGMSFSDTKKGWTQLWDQLEDCKKMKGMTNTVLRTTVDEKREARAEAKKAKGEVIALTKREHAKSKEKSLGAYSGVAATTLIISYQIVEVSGGWGKWEPVFQHEATIGVLQVIIGSILAFAMRPLQ